MNVLAISFQMVLGQMIQINGGELAEQTSLRGDAQGKDAAEVAARDIQLFASHRAGAHAVDLLKYFSKCGGGYFVAHRSMHAEVTVLAQRLQAAALTVGVALLFANINGQAR